MTQTFSASDVRRALGLRSTWMTIGVLSLSRPVGEIAAGRLADDQRQGDPGAEARFSSSVRHRVAAWQAGPALSVQQDGSFSVSVAPSATTLYRLSAGTIKSAVLRVVVSGV